MTSFSKAWNNVSKSNSRRRKSKIKNITNRLNRRESKKLEDASHYKHSAWDVT